MSFYLKIKILTKLQDPHHVEFTTISSSTCSLPTPCSHSESNYNQKTKQLLNQVPFHY